MGKIADLPDGGSLNTYDLNEIEIVSGHKDPCKIRYAVPQRFIDQGLTNLGAVSFNIQRADGRHEEKALVMGRLNGPRGAQFGALYLATAPPGSDEVRERLYIDHQQAIFQVPISAPNLGGGAEPGVFKHPNGRAWFVIQHDGNLVVYWNRVPFDYSTGVAQWASNTVQS